MGVSMPRILVNGPPKTHLSCWTCLCTHGTLVSGVQCPLVTLSSHSYNKHWTVVSTLRCCKNLSTHYRQGRSKSHGLNRSVPQSMQPERLLFIWKSIFQTDWPQKRCGQCMISRSNLLSHTHSFFLVWLHEERHLHNSSAHYLGIEHSELCQCNPTANTAKGVQEHD